MIKNKFILLDILIMFKKIEFSSFRTFKKIMNIKFGRRFILEENKFKARDKENGYPQYLGILSG